MVNPSPPNELMALERLALIREELVQAAVRDPTLEQLVAVPAIHFLASCIISRNLRNHPDDRAVLGNPGYQQRVVEEAVKAFNRALAEVGEAGMCAIDHLNIEVADIAADIVFSRDWSRP